MSEEQAHLQTIDERDAAEDALSEAYALVIGHAPEWSSAFSYRDALDQMKWTLKRERDHTEMVNKCGDEIGGFNHTAPNS